jgi:hypothetical protein
VPESRFFTIVEEAEVQVTKVLIFVISGSEMNKIELV